jgi:hypothetical protein
VVAGDTDVGQAMTVLRNAFGGRYHKGRDGFALRWLQPPSDANRVELEIENHRLNQTSDRYEKETSR